MKKIRNFILHYGDMTDSTNLIRLIQEIQPDEIYNLAAMSHVHVSFEIPEYTGNADGLGYFTNSGCGSFIGFGKENQNLSGFYFRTLWKGSGSSTIGNYTFLSTKLLML